MIAIRAAEAEGRRRPKEVLRTELFSADYLIERPLPASDAAGPRGRSGAADRRDRTAPTSPSRPSCWRR